jgi:hypothetical protein
LIFYNYQLSEIDTKIVEKCEFPKSNVPPIDFILYVG